MRKITADCTIGGLLHDVGKAVFRAGLEAGEHGAGGAKWLSSLLEKPDDFNPVLECVRFHHAARLRGAPIAPDSPAYVVRAADRIAAATDRRAAITEEGADQVSYDKSLPLSSVFNMLNGNGARGTYPPDELSPRATYPDSGARRVSSQDYRAIVSKLGSGLKKCLSPRADCPREKCADSLLGLLEVLLSFVPASTDRSQINDISLYDHLKMTAAAAGCIAEFLAESGISDYRTELFDNEADFMKTRTFLMFSCDFSGIQNFIYTVETKGALKALRSRSFALELFMEHITDEILGGCGLSRANLIYSGGGHAYVLLPNTARVKNFLASARKRVNRWLADNFGSALYLAFAARECSGNDLCNIPAEDAPYSAIFRDLSAELSAAKLSRYDADELRALNSGGFDAGRECRVCGTTDNVTEDGLCRWCGAFVNISNDVLRGDFFISVTKSPVGGENFIELPDVAGNGRLFAVFTDKEGARGYAGSKDGVRTYGKNSPLSGSGYCTNFYVGDYVKSREMAELAEDARGIRRIAVCRADVDDLGRAFIEGFARKDARGAGEKYLMQTLSRTAAFSRRMTMFFKYHINSILARGDNAVKPLELSGGDGRGRNLLVVYSGGDDIFIIGGWDDVIGAACDIEAAFSEYTGGALSISAGIGIFGEKFPIRGAALQTEELEAASKNEPGKNRVTLFETAGHTYKWRDFRDGVIPKERALEEYIDSCGNSFRGKAFLYRLLSFARSSESSGRLDIARCAYLLARAEPKNAQENERYRKFCGDVLSWMTDKNKRAEFITAVYIYIYLIRQRSGD